LARETRVKTVCFRAWAAPSARPRSMAVGCLSWRLALAAILATGCWANSTCRLDSGLERVGAHGFVLQERCRSLRLNGAHLQDKDAGPLAEAVHGKLTTLDVSGNAFGPAAVEDLVAALPRLVLLERLDVSRNAAGDTGAAAIAGALPHLPALVRLNLAGNGLGDTGAAALAAALVSAPKLEVLLLNRNEISDDGAVALADALGTAAGFSELSLGENRIGRRGAEALAKALAADERLRPVEVVLGLNPVGGEGEAAIVRAREKHEETARRLAEVSQRKLKGGEL